MFPIIILPERPVEFPSAKITQTFEQLAKRDLGRVMTKYLNDLVERLRVLPTENCNSVGLYFEMMATLQSFPERTHRDALISAFGPFVDEILKGTNHPDEQRQAEVFVKQVHVFIKAFGGRVMSVPKVH